MAAATEKETYEITFHGQYFVLDQGLRTTKNYEVTVLMNQDHVRRGPISVFKGIVAPEIMPGKYPDYAGLYTHYIKKAVPLSGRKLTDLFLMVRHQLIEYIEENELVVEERLFDSDGSLRQAVLECKADPDTFKITQDALRKRRGVALDLKNSFRELNKQASKNAGGGKKAADAELNI